MLDGNDPSKPGPGTYQAISLNKEGRYVYAKFTNSKCPKFGGRTDEILNKKLSKIYAIFILYSYSE